MRTQDLAGIDNAKAQAEGARRFCSVRLVDLDQTYTKSQLPYREIYDSKVQSHDLNSWHPTNLQNHQTFNNEVYPQPSHRQTTEAKGAQIPQATSIHPYMSLTRLRQQFPTHHEYVTRNPPEDLRIAPANLLRDDVVCERCNKD